MKRDDLANLIWMQALWFTAVLGAAAGIIWPAIMVLALFAAWQLQGRFRKQSDMSLIPIAIVLGLALDSTWIKLGWIRFAAPEPGHGIAPYWIVALWTGFALTINHSMAWLKQRLLLAGLMGALVGPFSYLAAQRLGALQVTTESWLWYVGMATGWGFALPFLLFLADRLMRIKQERSHV